MPNFQKLKEIHLKSMQNTPSKKISARTVALSVIKLVVCGNQDTQRALDKALLQDTLSPQDKKLCTELTYGTIRQKIRLDWFLQPLLANPEKLPVEIIIALEIALYEFFFLRIPAHASFDEAVSFAKQSFGNKIGGLVNAVLRTAQRKEALFRDVKFYESPERGIGDVVDENPDLFNATDCNKEKKKKLVRTQDKSVLYVEDIEIEDSSITLCALDAYARFCSMPIWVARLWANAYGEEKARSYLLAASKSAPIGIRLKEPASDSLFSSIEDTSIYHYENTSFAFTEGVPDGLQEMLINRLAARQSVASYEVLQALEPSTWAMPMWDCCAGRGGKTLTLAEAGFSIALASDVSKQRLQGLVNDMESTEFSIPVASGSVAEISSWLSSKGKSDLKEVSFLRNSKAQPVTLLNGKEETIPQTFGTVLVDAPCSGFGTLSRHPEIRLRRTKKDVEGLVIAQQKILLAAVDRVRPGGNLIYITCTLTPEENEQQVASFLATRPDIKVKKIYTTPHTSVLNEFFYGVCFAVP